MIDLGRALKAPFEDADWVSKTLLSFVWGLIGILFFPLLAVFTGVEAEYVRRVSRGDERIPDWSDFGKKWVEGLVVWFAGFLYFLPVFVLGAMAFAPGIIAAIQGEGDLAGGLFVGSACLFTIVAIVYGIAVSILYQAAFVNYAMRGSFGAFFAFGQIMDLVRGDTGYWTAWLYTLVISFGMSAVTSVLSSTMVGGVLYPAVLYLGTLMTAHVLGQWARRAFAITPAHGDSNAALSPSAPQWPQPPAPPAPPTPPAVPAPPAPPSETPPQ